MKKLLLVLLAVLVILCLAIYIFIPGKLTVTSTTVIGTTDIGIERFIIDETQWAKWWDYRGSDSASHLLSGPRYFIRGSDVFKLSQKFYKSIDIEIDHNKHPLTSKLAIIPLALDSTGIEWKCVVTTGANPYTRLIQYFEARKIKKNMDDVLNNLRLFLSKNENVYGIPIERNHLKDTLYVSAKSTLANYPSTPVIYELIKKIQAYLTRNNVKQTGNPIFNVTEIANGNFQLMAALPVSTAVPEVAGFSIKHMVRGSFMITEVTGGDFAVDKASKSLQQYFQDFRRTSMAMSFTMLVTDRLYQPDSTKWITRLYQPVY